MAKQIILFNLREGITEDEYLDWVKNTKAPAQLAVDAGKRFTMVKMLGAEKGAPVRGEEPQEMESPYKYAVIMDVTSLDAWEKGMESSKELSENVFPTWMTKYVADFMAVAGDEVYDKESG